MDITTGFTELRLSLADARDKLRQAKDAFEVTEAQAEQRAINNGLAGGKNIEERQRQQLIALQQDTAYLAAQRALRCAEANVDRLEALLEGARDARRVDEWRIRAALIEALNRAGDGAFDDAAQAELDNLSHGDLNSAYYAGKRRPQPTYHMLNDDPPF